MPTTFNSPSISRYSIWWRKRLHKLVRVLARVSAKRKIKLIRNSFVPNGRPTIYASTHVFRDDIACALSTIEENAFVLYGAGGDSDLPRKEQIAFWLTGQIPVRRGEKESRRKSLQKIMQILKKQGNILIYPEASWNISSALLVKKLWWGLLEAAKSTEANIVPVAVWLVGEEYHVIIGENFKHKKFSSRDEQIAALRDEMATLTWTLIEMQPLARRKDISNEYWLGHIKRLFDSVPWLVIAEEENYDFRPKGEISLGEILAEMHGIEYKSMAADYEQYQRIERLIDCWTKPVRF